MKKTLFTRVAFALSLLFVPLSALCHSHFYRAGSYNHEPRFDRNFLSSLDISLSGGSSKHAYGPDSGKTDLLNVYGLHNFSQIFVGTPTAIVGGWTATQTAIINNMNNNNLVNKSASFGTVLFTGKVNYFEANIHWAQNFKYGFFAESCIPIKCLEVTNVAFADQTAAGEKDANWQQFMANFNTALAAFNVTAGNVKNTTVGDIVSSVGWTYNNDNLKSIDFFDTTIKIGYSIPVADKSDRNQAFSIAAGRDGHVGIPVSFDFAIGFLDWVSWGAHVGGQFFLKQRTDMRVKTATSQNGFIKAALATGTRTLGNQWNIGTFLKADHLAGGFSLGMAYTFNAQEATTFVSDANNLYSFNDAIINGDQMLQAWNQHIFHVSAEYDFAKEGRAINPHIGLFYNRTIAGKRIFTTSTVGGDAGVNITWEF